MSNDPLCPQCEYDQYGRKRYQGTLLDKITDTVLWTALALLIFTAVTLVLTGVILTIGRCWA